MDLEQPVCDPYVNNTLARIVGTKGTGRRAPLALRNALSKVRFTNAPKKKLRRERLCNFIGGSTVFHQSTAAKSEE